MSDRTQEAERPADQTGAKREFLRMEDAVSSAPSVALQSIEDLVTRRGRLPRAVRTVSLSSELGHIYSINGGQTYMLQADGYYALNAAAGCTVIDAPSVIVDGVERLNPFVERNAAGRIVAIVKRAAMIGRDPSGKIIVVQETLHQDPEQWFKLALIKACYTPKTESGSLRHARFTDAAEMVSLDSIDRAKLSSHQIVVPLDEYVAVVVNTLDYKIRAIFENRVAVQRDATKRAHTVLFRRLCRAHPAFPASKIPEAYLQRSGDTATARIPMIVWLEQEDTLKGIQEALRKHSDLTSEALSQAIGTEVEFIDRGTISGEENSAEEAEIEAEEASERSTAHEALLTETKAMLAKLKAAEPEAVGSLLMHCGVDCELEDLDPEILNRVIDESRKHLQAIAADGKES